METIQIGDSIKFKAPTRNSNKAVWRKVNGFFGYTTMPTVRFECWPAFVVRLNEIIDVDKGGK